MFDVDQLIDKRLKLAAFLSVRVKCLNPLTNTCCSHTGMRHCLRREGWTTAILRKTTGSFCGQLWLVEVDELGKEVVTHQNQLSILPPASNKRTNKLWKQKTQENTQQFLTLLHQHQHQQQQQQQAIESHEFPPVDFVPSLTKCGMQPHVQLLHVLFQYSVSRTPMGALPVYWWLVQSSSKSSDKIFSCIYSSDMTKES